jgi:hypothetical protein
MHKPPLLSEKTLRLICDRYSFCADDDYREPSEEANSYSRFDEQTVVAAMDVQEHRVEEVH